MARKKLLGPMVLLGAALVSCHAQELAPPLPIPIVLGTPLIVPGSLIQSDVHAMSMHGCDGIAAADQHHPPSPTLQDLLGGQKVKQIDIVRIEPDQHSLPSVTGAYTPPAVTAIKRALRRRIGSSDCVMRRQPGANSGFLDPSLEDFFLGPRVQANIQFEDGIKRTLITDGNSVAVQDRSGRAWFLRLT